MLVELCPGSMGASVSKGVPVPNGSLQGHDMTNLSHH